MLYCEFLEGTGAPENAYSWAEYQRIEKIYNADDTMEKRDAYALYQKPDELTEALMNEISALRDQNRQLRKEKGNLWGKVDELRAQVKKLESEREWNRNYFRDLKRSLGDALYTLEDKFEI